MNKLTAFLLATTSFLAGVIAGFLLSPVKHGINIGNNNKIGRQEEDWDWHDTDDEEEELEF